MSRIIGHKNRGDYKDQPLYPSQDKNGRYIATSSKFKIDQIYVDTEDELEALIHLGYGARMYNSSIPQAPSFISHDNIQIIDAGEPHTTSFILAGLLSDTDGESISKTRKEQSILRAHLSNGKKDFNCTICGNVFPLQFLVAAHIKKRSECNHKERLDFANVATLMCKSGCDDLFEKGYIYVSEGKIKQNEKRAVTPKLTEIIDNLIGREVVNWIGSEVYYQWHESKLNK